MGDIKKAEKLVKKYPKWKKQIKLRVAYLKSPTPAPDDNVGGSKSNRISKPEEELLIRIDEDDLINDLKRKCEAIEYAMDVTTDVIRQYVREFCFKKPHRTLKGFITDSNYSNHTFYFERKEFFQDVIGNYNILIINKNNVRE